MAIFDRLKFWKRRDEFALPGLAEAGLPRKDELGLPPMVHDELGLPASKYQEPSFGTPTPPQAFKEMAQQASVSSRDVELLSSKLDTIKAMLDNISNRMAILEKQMSEEKTKQEQSKRIGWYA